MFPFFSGSRFNLNNIALMLLMNQITSETNS